MAAASAAQTPQPDETIPALLAAQVHLHGEREAVVAGDTRLSYRTLQARVHEAARALLTLGVRRGTHVAILMDNRPEWIVSCLAAQHLGATVVGLNTWATPREMEYALNHAEVEVLIAVDRFRRNDYRGMLDALRPWPQNLPQLRHIVWLSVDSHQPTGTDAIGWPEFLRGAARVSADTLARAIAEVDGDDVALLLYTSGSTAAPKGMLLQHRPMIRNAWNIGERQHVTHRDRLWLAVSLFWSFGSVNAMPNLLSHGGCIVLQDHFDAGEALALIARERCSVLYATPNMVLAMHAHPERAKHDLTCLRSGAMIGTPEQIALAVELGARGICNVYGLSETYGNCAVTDAAMPLELRTHSVGKPLPGVALRICHMETGADLPPGEVGEIRVRGPLFSAYYKDPERTRESFDERGFFQTGDLGMVDKEGHLYYRGRLKEMVKSGGINIAPAEVEECLMRHPAVRTAYVIGLPDAQLDELLAAVVLLEPQARVDADTLREHCRKDLAAYKVPARYRFATDGELPLTTTGKLQKLRLKELFGPKD